MTHLKPTDISTEELKNIMRLPIPEIHNFLRRHRLVVKWTDTKGESFTEGPELVNTLISITNDISRTVELYSHIEEYLASRSNSNNKLPADTDGDLPW